jgi:formylglycine-generating enzyme required for sulfatase activity
MARNWAITIGINHYRNLQPLNFAKRDAEAMQTYLLKELGCQTVNHFSDDSPPIPQDYGAPFDSQPTYGTLRRFLRVRFEQPFLKAGDNLWFFFAGHGIRHEDRDYLMPLDGDPGDVPNTAIPLHYVTERLQRCGADNVILLIDACRKRGERGQGIGEERHPGVITFFSCSPQESSYEIEALQQGAFTHALLAGLRLQGEGNCATVERLYHYLTQTVPRLNAQHGKPSQTPYGRIAPPTKNQLILLSRQATLTDVKELKYAAVKAEIKQNRTLAKQFWIRVLAVSPADPEAIEGIERLALVTATPSPPPQTPEPGRGVVVVPTFDFDGVTISRIEKTGLFGQGEPKVITQTRRGKADYYREELGNGVFLDLVHIAGGAFKMGAPINEGYDREKPQHDVRVASFWMGKYPVTQVQWRAVVALPKVERDLNADPAHFKGDNRPVEQVNWDDAVEFCQRLSRHTGRDYRLPSEAEWEYACRAGTTTTFHFGETITTDLANYRGTDWEYEGKTYPGSYGQGPKGEFRQETMAVGNFPANGFGLYDMHGNVWEWCMDHWRDSYEGAPTDGGAWLSSDESNLRLVRGGSWYFVPMDCRSACRLRFARDGQVNDLGFRVVCASP